MSSASSVFERFFHGLFCFRVALCQITPSQLQIEYRHWSMSTASVRIKLRLVKLRQLFWKAIRLQGFLASPHPRAHSVLDRFETSKRRYQTQTRISPQQLVTSVKVLSSQRCRSVSLSKRQKAAIPEFTFNFVSQRLHLVANTTLKVGHFPSEKVLQRTHMQERLPCNFARQLGIITICSSKKPSITVASRLPSKE